MSYDFSFEKKSIILIAGGCIVIGVLLFLAGLIVGLDKASGHPEAAIKQQSPQNKAETKPPVQDAERHAAFLQKPAPAQREQQSSPASTDNSKAPASQAQDKSPLTAGDNSKGKDEEPKEQAGFSLQLGAFQAEDHALKLRDNLKAKGYPVFLFRVLDGDGHIWHTVRIGHYSDTKQASEAAARFTSKERIPAWVRPSNAL